MTTIQDWLAEQAAQGRWESVGRFTSAQSLPALHEIPLLLLAGAVEGGCEQFRVHGGRNLQFSWNASLGPTGRAALGLLEHFGVDARLEPGALELPPFFWDYLEPLRRRALYAPLKLSWGERQVGTPVRGVWAGRSAWPRLTLVDRGVAFDLPVHFPGLVVIAEVGPLPGGPWPRQLVWGPALRDQLAHLGRRFQAGDLSPARSESA